MSGPFSGLCVLLATQPHEAFTDVLPGDFDFGFEHNLVDVLVELEGA